VEHEGVAVRESALTAGMEVCAKKGGTRVSMVHSNVPATQADSYEKGWGDFYFDPMKKYFAASRPAGRQWKESAFRGRVMAQFSEPLSRIVARATWACRAENRPGACSWRGVSSKASVEKSLDAAGHGARATGV
jgi:hypothetical protein